MKYLAGILVLMLVVPVSANLLVNGDFETGDTTGWNVATFWTPGWGTAPPVLDAKTGIGTFGGLGIPHEGSYALAADISGHANYHVGAYQTVDTVPGVEYVVDGWFAGGIESSNDTAWWEVKVSPGMTSDPDAAGTVIAKKERANAQPGPHLEFQESFSNTFVASDTQTTLFLKWGRAESADWKISAAGFDALSVTPEPASLALLGLGGLVLLRRRR